MSKNKYNVFVDDELIVADADFHKLQRMFKLNSNELGQLLESKKPMIHGFSLEEINFRMPVEKYGASNLRDWDEMTIAAELIRTGQGKIVSMMVDGEPKKVTVPR